MSTETGYTTWDDELLDHWEGSDLYGEEVAAEKQRRADEAAAEKARKRAAHERYLATPEGKLSSLKQELKAGEKELAEMPEAEAKAGRMHPDEILAQDPKRASRFAKGKEVANLRAQIVEAESRLPFNGKSSDDLVDQAAAVEADLAPLREKVKAADDQLRTRGIADTSFATQQARRDLNQAEAKLKPITAEIGYRKRDERNAAMQRDMETKAVKLMRKEALKHWEAESRRLRADLDDPVRSQLLDYAELQRAEKNVKEITAWNEKDPAPTKTELQRARERVATRTDILPDGPNAVVANW